MFPDHFAWGAATAAYQIEGNVTSTHADTNGTLSFGNVIST